MADAGNALIRPDEGWWIGDEAQEWTELPPVCAFCAHWKGDPDRYRVCAAFPDGIPEEIWTGRNTHQQHYPGDHGIHFELHPDAKRPPDFLRTGPGTEKPARATAE